MQSKNSHTNKQFNTTNIAYFITCQHVNNRMINKSNKFQFVPETPCKKLGMIYYKKSFKRILKSKSEKMHNIKNLICLIKNQVK